MQSFLCSFFNSECLKETGKAIILQIIWDLVSQQCCQFTQINLQKFSTDFDVSYVNTCDWGPLRKRNRQEAHWAGNLLNSVIVILRPENWRLPFADGCCQAWRVRSSSLHKTSQSDSTLMLESPLRNPRQGFTIHLSSFIERYVTAKQTRYFLLLTDLTRENSD